MQLTRQQRATLEYIADEGTCPDHHDLSRTMNLAESHDLPETVMGALSLYEDALGKETKAADALSEAKGHKKAMWERVRHVAKTPMGISSIGRKKPPRKTTTHCPKNPRKSAVAPRKAKPTSCSTKANIASAMKSTKAISPRKRPRWGASM